MRRARPPDRNLHLFPDHREYYALNHEPPARDKPERSQTRNPLYSGCVSYLRSRYGQWKVKRDQESAQDLASRRTADATIWIALFTLASVGVGLFQWAVLSGTLAEMRNEQRPWVYADLAVGGQVYQNQSGGLTFPIKFTFHNTGHLPGSSLFQVGELASTSPAMR